MMHGAWRFAIGAFFAGALCAPSHGQYSAPPAAYKPKLQPAAPAKLLLPADAQARTITLAAPSDAERSDMKAQATDNAKSATIKSRRLQIGFARQVPSSSRSLRLADLSWQDAGGKVKASHVRLISPGAAAIRLAVRIDHALAAVKLRFLGSATEATVFGPYSAADIARHGEYWSPVLDGDTAIIELEVPSDMSVDAAAITIPTISHLEVSGSGLKQQDPRGRIGFAGSCEMDVMCIGETVQQQAASAIGAVARIVLVDHGSTYLCSGTLVNDTVSSMTPYFYTANHCIDNGDQNPSASRGFPAATVATITAFWFFQAEVCGVDTPAGVNFIQTAGGAKLVGRSNDYDWALLKLNAPPPAGVTFAAWNAEQVATNTAITGIHHPMGDLKKWSTGGAFGYERQNDGSSYMRVQWTQGVTEPGSSGSGVFVLNPDKNYYELRGGLWGGSSACSPSSARSSPDYYSRLDVAFPHLASSLSPNAPNPKQQMLVVEFYHAVLDDYFITVDPAEIADLDNGVHDGWVRTGLTFLAYADPATAPADAKPVCRFYVLPQVGDSHFYSADADECVSTAARFSGSWVQESAAVFYIQIPNATGVCPADTRPVFRFLQRSVQLHHRYTAEVDVRDSIIRNGGWTQEGFGSPPSQVVMCSPTI